MFSAGDKFDKYTIVRQLGEGGMAIVYEATNPFGLSVVLKMLHPSLTDTPTIRERFLREGRIQYTLKHPHIVRVTDMVQHENIPALVVDFMAGEDLEQRMLRGQTLTVDEIIQISSCMLDGLQLAHEHGFIHRDLKPSNIFLENTDGGVEARLMDFGIAKITEAEELTQAQEFCGTPAYASPEQIASTRDVDALTDVYSFGVVMWSMVTGHEPFADRGHDPYAVLAAVVREPLPALPDYVPSWLRRVIETATTKDPEKRFQSAAEFRDALLAGADADLGTLGSFVDLRAAVNEGRGGRAAFRFSDSGESKAVRGPAPLPPVDPLGETSPIVMPDLAPAPASPPRVRPQAQPQPTQPARPTPAQQSQPARSPVAKEDAPRRPTRAEAARAKAVERSFSQSSGKRGRGIGRYIVLGIIIIGLAVGGTLFALNTFNGLARTAPAGFVRVEPGTFSMGSAPGTTGHSADEAPHTVTITRPFAISTVEVTQAAWTTLMFSANSAFPECGDQCPMTNVSWHDAVRFANRRSIAEDLTPCYEVTNADVAWPDGLDCEGYRLPTEAEWEYAARAGATTDFANGDIQETGRATLDPRLSVIGWYGANSDAEYIGAQDCSGWGDERAKCGPQPVQTRRASAWGLYDMHGNVAEWVWDRYAEYGGDAVDPTGAVTGSQRVVRGGSWRDTSEGCRSAAREHSSSVGRNNIGFRLVRTLR